MPRALFISISIPPFAQSHTIRNVFLLRGLVRAGFTVDIVTSSHGGDTSLVSLLPECNIVRTPLPPLDKLFVQLREGRLRQLIGWLLGIWTNFVTIPDQHVGWDRLAEEAAMRLDQTPDVVIASSGSFTAQLAAKNVAKRLGVAYVADMGDPWTYNPIWPGTVVYRKIRNKRLETRSVAQADLITVTTEGTALGYRRWFPASRARIEVVPMGYLASEFPNAGRSMAPSNPIRIVYVGVAYRTGRNLTPLLEAAASLAQRHNIQLDVVGPHSKAFVSLAKSRAYSFVRFRGRIPYKESLDIIDGADVLVVIGNPGTMQIPGKAFMYLGAGRPIILIAQNPPETDPTWQLLRAFPATSICGLDVKSIAEKLSVILDELVMQKHVAASRITDPNLLRYEWNCVGDHFATLVAQVVHARNSRNVRLSS